jgi:hypothetical protein
MPTEQETDMDFVLEELAALVPSGVSDLDLGCNGCSGCGPSSG